MALLAVSDLGKYYGADEVFSGLSFAVHSGNCIALVGVNGCGKSTLLNILAGCSEPDAGSISRARDLRLGYLPQIPDLDSEGTLWSEMEAVFSKLMDQAQELRVLEKQMAIAEDAEREAVMARYGVLLEAFEQAGGFTYEARIARVLGGLGFQKEEFQTPVAYLSGGEKTRALLARLLLEEPDLLLLDEPTNHLDLEGIEWLEEQLLGWRGAIIVVAHDRAFLDTIAGHVWELEDRHLNTYRGNYTAYQRQRAEQYLYQQKVYESQQDYIAQTEDYIRRYMAGQRSSQAKGRLKRLEREERLERPQEYQRMRLDLETTLRSGDLVLGLYDVQAGYGNDAPLVAVEEAEIRRGQRVALVGPNGSGKTTLLRTILRQIRPVSGRVRLGSAVRIGYFAQVQAHLDPSKTVLDTLLAAGMVSLSETRSFLARYAFRGDDVFKEIGVLSGGERARVALALLALQKANFLLLDEPTNHLDLPSQEVLQDVLTNFSGTILLVSHDRYLIRELATRVWAISEEQLYCFKSYADYGDWRLEQRGETSEIQQAQAELRKRQDAEKQAERTHQRALARQQARLQALEDAIHKLELRLQELTAALDVAGRAQDTTRVAKLGAEYHQVEAEINDLLEEWTDVSEAASL